MAIVSAVSPSCVEWMCETISQANRRERLTQAVHVPRECGFMGVNVLGSNFTDLPSERTKPREDSVLAWKLNLKEFQRPL